jgi:hypothetical protein
LGTLTSWNPLGHSRPVTGLLYLYLYITKENQKCICYAFKDIILDSVQKMTEAEEREDKKNSADKSLGLM